MRFTSITAALACAAGLAGGASAQVALNGTYAQNFDSMGQTGTAAPAGWTESSLSGGHDDFSYAGSTAAITTTVLPGGGPAYINTGPSGSASLSAHAALTAVTGPTNQRSSSGFNFGLSASPTDRALGTSPTGVAACELQLAMTNSTGAALIGLSIGYDIRRFSTTVDNNNYNVSPWHGEEELPGYWLFYSTDNGASWANVSALNPMDLVNGGPSGISVPNSIGVTTVPLTSFSFANPVAPGGSVLLRWIDDNAQSPSPDQLIGLDNVTVSSVPAPGAVGLIVVGSLLAARRRRA